MAHTEAGIRERKKQRTRADLEQAALRLFSERGYDQVTVDDIADAAGVSARTFFRHFGAKEDVLMQDHHERLERLREQLGERPAEEGPLRAVHHAVLALAETYESEKEELFLRTKIMADTPSLVARSLELQQQWEAAIAEAVAARLGVAAEGDLRPALVGACAVAALRVAVDTWLAAEGRQHLPSLVDTALVLIGADDPNRWMPDGGASTGS